MSDARTRPKGSTTRLRTPDLRTLLRANAVFASATGLTALAATGPVARLIGVGEHRLVSATGGGLLLFAVGLVITSGAPAVRLIPTGRLISFADALWVVGTVVIIGLADLPARGNLVLGIIAAIVGAFAALQLRAADVLSGSGRAPAGLVRRSPLR